MASLTRIRFHGRGGEGVKLASRIVSRAAFLHGDVVQDSPVYGAERRGAPVVAFVRIGRAPIYERGYIEAPDVVAVMDVSLLDNAEAAVLDGVSDDTLVLLNSGESLDHLRQHHQVRGRAVVLDVSSIVLDLLQHHLPSAPMAGFVVKAAALAPWEQLAAAAQFELTEIGLLPDAIVRNLAATRRAYEQAGAVMRAGEPAVRKAGAPPAASPSSGLFVVPQLPARIAAPSMEIGATSALRSTEGWRLYRPVIERARCTRCFLCFALCPEGAIHLDAENYPVIDYDHCKGCLVCVTECPPTAITQVREAAHDA